MDFSGVPVPGSLATGDLLQNKVVLPAMLGGAAAPSAAIPGYAGEGSQDLYGPGEFVEVKNLVVDGGDRFGVSAVAFDSQEELLWMGNQGGHVTSYYGLEMQKFTSFQVHDTFEVRQMLTTEGKLFSLTKDSLICNSKYGRPLFQHRSENVRDMQCMIQTGPKWDHVLMGGHQPLVVEFDVECKKEIRKVEIKEPGCAILRYSNHYICAGDTSGKVTLRDPQSFKAEHVLQAHSGTLSDFDVHGTQLVTCGFSKRGHGNMSVDRFLMVYDLRFNKAMTPMQMTIEPMFLRFVPTYSNRLCVVSQSGQFQVMEQGALTPASMILYQVQTEGAALNAFDISTSCQVLAFGDSGGFLHMFASAEQTQPVINLCSTETEFTQAETLNHHIAIDDELTPLSIIPMQYPSSGKLLSDWPDELMKPVYRKPMRIDPEIFRGMKIVQNVGYAPNPGTRRRNQAPYKVTSSKISPNRSNVPDSPLERGEDPFVLVPKRYRKVEIRYSKLGVEDFDFRHYNKTNFAGLETHIPNAYCNAMLQVLYFVEPLRVALLSHLCQKEFCLACELGFLFHMLDNQKGKTCQANNFLRAFRTIPEASALGLVLNDAEESMGKINLPRLIQNWNRFILQQMHSEFLEAKKVSRQDSSVDESHLAELGVLPVTESWDAAVEQQDQREKRPVPMATDADATGEASDKEEKTEAKTPKKEKDKASEKEGKEPLTGEDGTAEEKLAEETEGEPKEEAEEEEGSSSGKAKDSMIKQLFGCDLENTFTCKCGQKIIREMTASVIDLNYPDLTLAKSQGKNIEDYTFASIVERSMCREVNTQAWCSQCERYQPHLQAKVVQHLPNILSLNCHLENARDFEFWKVMLEVRRGVDPESSLLSATTPRSHKLCRYGLLCTRRDCRFRHETDHDRSLEGKDGAGGGPDEGGLLPEEAAGPSFVPIGLRVALSPEGKVIATNIEEESEIPAEWSEESLVYYELLATTAYIKDTKTGGNLVSHIQVGERYHQRKEKVTCSQWYLYNDFAITPIEQHEAVHFNLDWKIPCVIYFARKDLVKKFDFKVKNPVTSSVLFSEASLVTPRRKHVTFLPLDEGELPASGDVIGLDAEFVTLNQEEAELRSDGTRSMIKPSQMSVARITCVRGKGPLLGEPFIDDYISTQEQVVDYLTQFSGIQPGDLDASISSKHLTTLKCTYEKLRYLVDSGVTFVGHGLKKDFRVINIVVPKDQVIDTVELFHLPRQRMISLKFLAWFFLGITIQSVTHDSIEDARTALKLYHKYEEMAQVGIDTVRGRLKDMYEKGRKLQWKIPEDEVAPPMVESDGPVLDQDELNFLDSVTENEG